jgi:L-iditol 2-dehydrogenase
MCAVHRENLCENQFRAIGYQFNGGFAEQMIMPRVGVDQGCLIPVPEDIDAAVGTLVEPLSCCVNGMQYIPMEEMEHVIIFGGGIIGVLNGLVAKARGAGCVTVMDVSQDRLDLLARLGLPFENLVNSGDNDPEEWVREHTGGRGVNAVVVAASVKPLVTAGIKLLARAGHLSIFAGMPKSDPVEPTDLNLIHYRELNVHGANSSAIESYLQARDWLVSGRVDGAPLVTHRFPLEQFNDAFATQRDPSTGALKVVIIP